MAEKVLSRGIKNEGFGGEEGLEDDYGYKNGVDHTRHQLFIKLDELQGVSWVEKSRYNMLLFYSLQQIT